MKYERRPLVWLAAPYAGPTEMHRVVETAANIWRAGALDFLIPQVMAMAGLSEPMSLAEFQRWRFQFIGHSDAVLCLEGWETDRLATEEVEWAHEQEIPVFDSALLLTRWWQRRNGGEDPWLP